MVALKDLVKPRAPSSTGAISQKQVPYRSNFPEAGRNLSGNNKMVHHSHNGGSKNGIGSKTKIKGKPILGDKSGNTIKSNNTTVINNNVDIGKSRLQCSICTHMCWFMILLSFHLHKDAVALVQNVGKMTWMCPILCQKVFVHVPSEICAHKVEETGVAVLEENPGCADSKGGVSEDKKKRLRGDSYRFRVPITHSCQDRACKNIEKEEILEFVFIIVM